MMLSLYQISAPDGRSYFGVTKQALRRRFMRHARTQSPIGKAIRYFALTPAAMQRRAIGNGEYIRDLERKAIATFCTRWPQGFNISEGGWGGRDPLPVTRALMSACKQNDPRVTAQIEKLAVAKRGKPFVGVRYDPTGRQQSPEHVAKRIANSVATRKARGYYHNPE
jgi:hypothetical protein